MKELAHGPFGQHVYGLQDNGIPLAPSQAEVTPMQRYCYALAKDHHTDTDVDTPNTVSSAQNSLRGF